MVPILDAPLSTSGEAGLAHVDVTAICVAQTITVPVPCAVKFAPDGRRFACDLEWQGQLWLGSLERGDDITSERYPMAWSSNGRYLAYGISPGLEGIPELWVVDADGSNPHKLYVESGEYPHGHFEYFRWLPGGDAIFFIYVPRGLDPYQRAKYEVVSAADGATQVLFSSGGYLELIKEGRFLSFYSAEDERFRSRLAILAYGSEEAQ